MCVTPRKSHARPLTLPLVALSLKRQFRCDLQGAMQVLKQELKDLLGYEIQKIALYDPTSSQLVFLRTLHERSVDEIFSRYQEFTTPAQVI